jgi:uncharacterized SAM-binding protein YcdF (DUF218 family)
MWLVKRLLEVGLSPLGVTTLLLAGGLLLSLRRRPSRAGCRLLAVGAGLFLVWLFSPLAELAIRPLEVQYTPLLQPPAVAVDRIVVLAGYGERHPAIPVTSNVSHQTLCNMAEGIRLYHLMAGTKVLLSGGSGRREDPPVAGIMADFLRAMGVPAHDILIEGQSQNTYENLVYVKQMIGTQPFVLVAAACDLPRAMAVAYKLGMRPVAAPACIWTLQHYGDDLGLSQVLGGFTTPSLGRLGRLQWAFHEYVGYVWYKLRGWV